MYLIYGLLGLIVILVCILIYQKNSYQNQQSKQYQERIKKLQEQYNKEKEKEEKSYQAYLTSIKEQEKLCDQLVEKEKQLVNEKVENYWKEKQKEEEIKFQAYKITRQDEINKEVIQLEIDYNTNKEYLTRDLENTRIELNDLKRKREAYIEALKAEEKRQEERAFYTINLSEENIEDIKILRSVEDKLNNKEALNRLVYDVFVKKPLNDLLLRIIGTTTYSGIYKITNLNTQRAYIGRSVDVKKRLTEHVKGAFNIATIADQEIHRAMGREGINNFSFEILEQVEKDKLNEREKYWIDFYQTQSYGYNQNKGG